MSDIMGGIEKLIGADINDPAALKKEAKERIKEYFKTSAKKRWALLTPTYQSKVTEAEYIEDSGPWWEAIDHIKVRKIKLRSGVLCTVTLSLFFKSGRESIIKASLLKEAGIRQPDPAYPFLINGTTVPPYLMR